MKLYPHLFYLISLAVLGFTCKNETPKQEISAEENPLEAIEAMVDETKALAKEEAAKVDQETFKKLRSLSDIHFEEGTVGEKLYAAIEQGKDLMQEVFLFKTLSFHVDKAEVLPEMNVELQQLALILKKFSIYKIEIGAHTQGLGDFDFNLALSRDRAKAVLEALHRMGINKSRMTARGYGDEFPIADPEMMEGRMANERVELTFVE